MKYKALAAAIALASVNAYALEGTIVNGLEEPVAGASVKAAGLPKGIITDERGRFDIPGEIDELHITAPGYSHKTLHLHEYNQQGLVIKLLPTVIEQVDVIGLPIHASVIESALPVTVLHGEDLRRQQAATLGDSLERLPGVTTNFHGNVASTPVIRGLSGPRVLITQNSLDVSDVSRVGPDHAVASEVSTAQQIEVLRGPATLFYGSGAIGGVVNVVDQRVPTDPETRGEFLVSRDTVNNQNLASFNATTGTENVAFYADGFWRDADDYDVPVAPEDEHEEEHSEDSHDKGEHSEEKTVANSAEESNGFTLGASYLLDNGYIGIAAEQFNREYGIPGHSHGEEEGGEKGSDEEEQVFADLEQKRYQLQSEFTIDSSWLRAINARAAYTDYTHSEIENGNAATMFSNQTSELRLDLFHQELQHWRGGFNFHYKHSEVGTDGEEAFTPPSEAETFAFAVMEERHFGEVLLQLGARTERVVITADNVLLPPVELHQRAEESEADVHDDEHSDESIRVFELDQEFAPFSVSFGAVWDFSPGYNVGISLSHAERAPSASELLSFGPHVGSGFYEIGALFQLREGEGDAEPYFELNEKDIELETSNNIDLSFRKHEGDLGIILNAFFNTIDNFYYQKDTGFNAEAGHAHEEEEGDEHNHDAEGEDEHVDELPVLLFQYEDAELYGFEAQVIWKLTDAWQTTFFSDFVRAELSNGGYLPRTPPLRFGADLDFSGDRISANLHWTHHAEQDKVASLETTTKGYNMLDASLSYRLHVDAADLSLFVKAENLTDTEARVHTSFIKNVAPRPGRNFSLGIRGGF